MEKNILEKLANAIRPKKFMSIEELSDYLGMSKTWIRDQMKVDMPYLKVGEKSVRYDVDKVTRWFNKRFEVA